MISNTNYFGFGISPGTSLAISEVLDIQTELFDSLFGDETQRDAWINAGSDVDIEAELSANLANVIGSPELDLTCSFNETLESFSLDVDLAGSVQGSSLSAIAPQISLLPDSLPAFDLDIPTLNFGYKLTFQINVGKNKFLLGETKIDFFLDFLATASQDLPILPSADVSLTGTLGVEANFTYSSLAQGWAYVGGYLGTLDAAASAAPSVANLGLRVYDGDMFDDEPRELKPVCDTLSLLCYQYKFLHYTISSLAHVPASVRFNFDVCDFTDSLKSSIQSLAFSDELSDILDEYLGPALAKASFIPSSLTANVKSTIVSAADNKVNEVKGWIMAEIDSLFTQCQVRRLGEIEIDQFGSQRILSEDLTFKALSDAIESFTGVVSLLIDILYNCVSM